jgi:hypothetical protein
LGVRLRRDALGRHAQGVQESPDGLSGGNGGFGRVEAAQVHMQLPAGETGRDLVRPVQGQRGLAHTGGAADRGDHHRPRRARSSLLQDPGQRCQLTGPAGEIGHRRGQLPRHWRRRWPSVA